MNLLSDTLIGFAMLSLVPLGLWHYHTALVITIFLLPAYLLRLSLFGLPTNVFEISVIVVAILGLCQRAVRHSWLIAAQKMPRSVLIFGLCFLGASIIATIISPQTRVSLGILKSWIFIPLLFSWLIFSAAQNQLIAHRLIRGLVWSGTATALWGLTQIGRDERITSVYDVPNSLALWLAPLLVLALWRSLAAGDHSWATRLGILTMSVALLATQSAAALVAVVATLLVGITAWLPPPRRAKWYLMIFIVLAAGSLVYSGRLAYLVNPWTSGQANSLSVRQQLWSVSIELLQHHPLLGIGLGQFEPAYQQVLHERFQDYAASLSTGPQPLPEFVVRDPHNWLLSLWLNTGLLGLFSFIGLHVAIFWRAKWRKPHTQALLLSLLSLLLFGLVDTIFWKNDLAALHFVLLALTLADTTAY
ncbi:MAG: O-antigen ligase family protein [Candidatus Andersenbacteria bacterium]